MRGARIVMVPESSLSEAGLDALARALSHHPRMLFFAVNVSRDSGFQSTDWKPLHLLCGKQSRPTYTITCLRCIDVPMQLTSPGRDDCQFHIQHEQGPWAHQCLRQVASKVKS